MKAVILAGGNGSRLYPITNVISKQLIPVGGKPLIYYPISISMLGGCDDILIITQQKNIPLFQEQFSKSQNFNIKISYVIQDEPLGIAHGLYLAKEFVGNEKFLFLLGDNIVHGNGITHMIAEAFKRDEHTIFSKQVDNPREFGVIVGDKWVQKIDEKPVEPLSDWASIGMYVFNANIFDFFDQIKFSDRGELELPTLIMEQIKHKNKVFNQKLGRGFVWFDAGTIKNFNLANSYILFHEEATGKAIGMPEEIALNNNFMTKKEVEKIIGKAKSDYFKFLQKILWEK